MITPKRCLLVDANNLFIRHYTVNPSLDKSGVPVGGVVGSLKSLVAMASLLRPTSIIFVWDGEGGSAKKRSLFKEYKDGRKQAYIAGKLFQFSSEDAMKDNKKWQIILLRSIVDDLPINQIITSSIEADDAIAYIVKNSKYFNFNQCIIATCDKDFYQLIDKSVAVYNPASKKLLCTQDILQENECHPKHWRFLKSICGDNSDKIDGVSGIGPKTVAKLFDIKNPDIELNPDTIQNIKNSNTLKNLNKKYDQIIQDIEKIKRNWQLVDLKENLMISDNSKSKLTNKVENFSPKINKQDLHKKLISLGGTISPFEVFQIFCPLIA